MVKTEHKLCIICRESFECAKSSGKGRGNRMPAKRVVRRNGSVTCSGLCSKIYAEVYRRVRARHRLLLRRYE